MNKKRPTLTAAKSYLSLHCHELNEINYFNDLRESLEWNWCYPFPSSCEKNFNQFLNNKNIVYIVM